MTNKPLSSVLKFYIPLFALSLLFSCKQNTTSFTASQAASIKDSVMQLANNTAKDITAKGPIAWLDYFENSPDFFMASDGDLAFVNYAAANSFIKNTLVHQMRAITLKWSNIRINPTSPDYATMAANFHEDITDLAGKTMPFDGYFTATVHQTTKGWKYLNMHWSIKPGK